MRIVAAVASMIVWSVDGTSFVQRSSHTLAHCLQLKYRALGHQVIAVCTLNFHYVHTERNRICPI